MAPRGRAGWNRDRLYEPGGGVRNGGFERVTLTRSLIGDYGIIDGRRVVETPARDAGYELARVHSERYIDAVRRAGHVA